MCLFKDRIRVFYRPAAPRLIRTRGSDVWIMREVIPREWLWSRFGTVCSLWGPTYVKGFFVVVLFLWAFTLGWAFLWSSSRGYSLPHPYHLMHFQKHWALLGSGMVSVEPHSWWQSTRKQRQISFRWKTQQSLGKPQEACLRKARGERKPPLGFL